MSIIYLSLPSGAHIVSSSINHYSIQSTRFDGRSTITKVGYPGTIVVHREELEDGDHHLDDCYIVRLFAKSYNKCQVHPSINLTGNKHIAVQEIGYMHTPGTKS